MALASGIPASVWAAEGEQAIYTALAMLDQAHGSRGARRDRAGRQMSG